jgi:hypothetical protein
MRIKNATVPKIGRQFFWDRLASDLAKAGYKRGPKRRYLAAEVVEQLELHAPQIFVKATLRG